MNLINNISSIINFDEIRKIQDSFFDMTGLNALTIDVNGNVLIDSSRKSFFCDELVHNNYECNELCKQCRRYAAKKTLESKKANFYICHMGLMEFAIPITVDNEIVAICISGMAFNNIPEKSFSASFAAPYNFNPDYLFECAKKVPVVSLEKMQKSADFLYNIAGILSDSASSKLKSEKALLESLKVSQMKDDFLANMSHELRTPMNAVIGMTDIALKEDMSNEAREYVEQIKTSGKALLHIINDILDYSKITSGKLDIFEDEYEPLLLFKNISNIISNRLQDKSDKVNLFFDINPSIPKILIGDAQRIQQIIINLANNAVKFTNEGSIKIEVNFKNTSEDNIMLDVKIIDSGIGIRQEDLGKLFASFSQVDSKRNRNVEGTGLGLAITKNLLSLMNGNIDVSSVYGSGSTFHFSLPQRIAKKDVSLSISDSCNMFFLCFISDYEICTYLSIIADKLGFNMTFVHSFDDEIGQVNSFVTEHSEYDLYLLLDDKMVENGTFDKIKGSPKYNNFKTFVLTDSYKELSSLRSLPDIKLIKKPISIISFYDIFNKNGENSDTKFSDTAKENVKFIVHDAKVLLVDDTPLNLRVAEKLLEPVGIKADKALSGKQAVDKLSKITYDLIFMDHMMPELDGIDTTRIIRRFYPKMNSIPIIALTANASDDAKKYFLSEGMNDFLAKPIEIKLLNQILLKYLPKNKIEIIE